MEKNKAEAILKWAGWNITKGKDWIEGRRKDTGRVVSERDLDDLRFLMEIVDSKVKPSWRVQIATDVNNHWSVDFYGRHDVIFSKNTSLVQVLQEALYQLAIKSEEK